MGRTSLNNVFYLVTVSKILSFHHVINIKIINAKIKRVIHGSQPQQWQQLPQLNQAIKPAGAKVWHQFKFPLSSSQVLKTDIPTPQSLRILSPKPNIPEWVNAPLAQRRLSSDSIKWSLHRQRSLSLTSSHSVLGTVFPAIGMQNSCPTQFIRGLGAPGGFIVLKDWLPMSTRTDMVTEGSPEGLLLYYVDLGLGDPDERTGGCSYHNRQ